MIKTREKIIKEFLEAYNKNPRGWHFLYGFDKERRLNIYIGNENEDSVWAIITEPHFGIGARIDDTNIEKFLRERWVEFGLRKVPKKLAKKMFRELLEYGNLSERTIGMISEMLKEYLPRDMKIMKECGLIGIGPYFLIPHIETIDERITSELGREFEERLGKRVGYIA